MNKSNDIKKAKLCGAGLVVAVLLLWLTAGVIGQQNPETKTTEPTDIDARALIWETQKISHKAGRMTLLWWVPEQFWQVSSIADPTVTPQQAEQLIKVLRPYTLIIVADGWIDSAGMITYSSEAQIRAGIEIRDSRGNSYQPLSENNIDAEARSFLSVMRPILVGMSGSMGQKMHLFFFDAESKAGGRIADAETDGVFSVKLNGREFRWRLPLDSLVSPKICPTCKEQCSGAWNFCPWCGARLLK